MRQAERAALRDGESGFFPPRAEPSAGERELSSAWLTHTATPHPGIATRRATGPGKHPAGMGTGPCAHTSPRRSFPPSRSQKRKKKRGEEKSYKICPSARKVRQERNGQAGGSCGGDKGSSVAPVLVVLAAAAFRHRIQMDILQLSPAERGLNA